MLLAFLFVFGLSTSALAQESSQLAGRWRLSRELSELPREVGFEVDWAINPEVGSGSGGGRSGGRLPPGAFNTRRESQEDAKRMQLLTAEVREPSTHFIIAETPSVVTFTNDRGQVRTFHPDGREESIQLGDVSAIVVAKREGDRLVILYHVQEGRQLRYTFSRSGSPAQLIVEVEFIEKRVGDKVRRVYEPASETETMVTPPPPTPPVSLPAAAKSSTSGAPPSTPPAVPASGGAQPETFNQQPDAQFKGLTKLGVVIEGIGQQATACGLSQSALDTAVSKKLTDAGLTVVHDTDEDTYVYVNIMTSSLSTGLCISRYDAYLYTYTTAKLSYTSNPVLVQVSLLHKGGIAGGSGPTHAEQVMKGLQDYADQFATRIRNANK